MGTIKQAINTVTRSFTKLSPRKESSKMFSTFILLLQLIFFSATYSQSCNVNHDCPKMYPICNLEYNSCSTGLPVQYPCNTTNDCPKMETCGTGSIVGWNSVQGKFCARYHTGILPLIICKVNHDCIPFDATWGCNFDPVNTQDNWGYCEPYLSTPQLGCMTTDDCMQGFLCSEQKTCVLASEPEPYWCMDSRDCPDETPYCLEIIEFGKHYPKHYCVARE